MLKACTYDYQAYLLRAKRIAIVISTTNLTLHLYLNLLTKHQV